LFFVFCFFVFCSVFFFGGVYSFLWIFKQILRTGSSVIQCPSLISLYCLIYQIINEINIIVNGYSLIVRLLMQ
jgi:hypothetical protein